VTFAGQPFSPRRYCPNPYRSDQSGVAATRSFQRRGVRQPDLPSTTCPGNRGRYSTALRQAALYLHLHDRGAVVVLSSQDGVARITYAIYAPGVESSEQIGEGAIAITCNVIRSLCGADWAPTEVLLASRRPADVRPYRRFFRAPVRFDVEQNALVFPASVLDRRLPQANPELQRLLLEEVQRLDRELALDFSTKVRRVACAGLVVGQCSADRKGSM